MKSRYILKPEDVVIVQFSVTGEEGNAYGLGDDQKVYFWSYADECWKLYRNTEIVPD